MIEKWLICTSESVLREERKNNTSSPLSLSCLRICLAGSVIKTFPRSVPEWSCVKYRSTQDISEEESTSTGFSPQPQPAQKTTTSSTQVEKHTSFLAGNMPLRQHRPLPSLYLCYLCTSHQHSVNQRGRWSKCSWIIELLMRCEAYVLCEQVHTLESNSLKPFTPILQSEWLRQTVVSSPQAWLLPVRWEGRGKQLS